MQINISGDRIEISRDGVNTIQVIDGKEIVELTPVFNDFSNVNKDPATLDMQRKYGYSKMTVVNLSLKSKKIMKIELQDVSNQGTWNTGTQGALNTAVAAFEATME